MSIISTLLPVLGENVSAQTEDRNSACKGEHDLALGNIIGSNLFNTLAVVGIAGGITPLAAGPEVFSRDMLVMGALTLSLFVFGYGLRGAGRISRLEGGALPGGCLGYTGWLAYGLP